MVCPTCETGERRPAVRARVTDKNGTTAVVLGVPVEECPSCGQIWLTVPIAIQLDATFNRLLDGDAEVA